MITYLAPSFHRELSWTILKLNEKRAPEIASFFYMDILFSFINFLTWLKMYLEQLGYLLNGFKLSESLFLIIYNQSVMNRFLLLRWFQAHLSCQTKSAHIFYKIFFEKCSSFIKSRKLKHQLYLNETSVWDFSVRDFKLVTISECWWLNFYSGDIFQMWVPDTYVKRGCWWPEPSMTACNCHQRILSPTFITNIGVTRTIVDSDVGPISVPKT